MTVRERGGKWQAIVRVKQYGVLVHSEAKTFDTERLAKDWKKRVTEQIKKGGPAARVQTRTTLGDLIDKYHKAQKEVRPLRRQLAHELDQLHSLVSDWRLDAITSERFADFARKRRADGAGPTTVLHNLATLRSILNAARPMFGIDVNGEPVSQAINALTRMGFVSKSNERERRVDDETLLKLQAEFERTRSYPSTTIDMTPVMWIAVHFPRRLGELTDMRWADYGASKILLRDTKHPTKPRNEIVPVPPKARALIDAISRLDERILPYKSESVSAAWRRACERLKIEDLHFHDLRHEGICRLFEKGLQIQEVSLISGHTSWAMLRRYTHLTPEKVLEKLE